jgi:hypothetical protein
MIEVREVTNIDTQTFEFDSERQRLSDWVEAQPLERFTCGTFRSPKGQMCGVGMIADYYGYWNRDLDNRLGIFDFVAQFIPSGLISTDNFDQFYVGVGAETAKKYVVDSLRRAGL